MESLLIKAENENPDKALCLILDNHQKHIKSHLFRIYKKGMFKHILVHIKLLKQKRKSGIPAFVNLDNIMKQRMRK